MGSMVLSHDLKTAMSDAGDVILQWDQHNRTRDIKLLWDRGEFLDVTLVCDDDDQVEAHKLVLSAASPFFRKILQRNPHSHPLLYLRGASKKDIQALVIFIYSGETQVMQDELESFMSLANNLQIQGLVGEYLDVTEDNNDEFVSHKEVMNSAYKSAESTIEELTKCDADSEKNRVISQIDDEISVEKSERIIRITSEYDRILSDLVYRKERRWMCNECPSYKTENKHHAIDHAERHIKGFALECKFCDKTFTRKKSVRQHMGREHREKLRNVGRPKLLPKLICDASFDFN